MKPQQLILSVLVSIVVFTATPSRAEKPGAFEDHGDVGGPGKAGTAVFDDAKRSYTVTGGGANMWLAKDSFHFVWKKVSGDVSLAADIEFVGKGGDPHRKACLLVRQSLDADAVYADAALHGDGLTSLQYRETKGSETREVKSMATAPRRLRLEKHGRDISLSVAGANGGLQAVGKLQLDLSEPYYVGLGVCAHNDAQLETAVFSNVELTPGAGPSKKSAADVPESKQVPDANTFPNSKPVRDPADPPGLTKARPPATRWRLAARYKQSIRPRTENLRRSPEAGRHGGRRKFLDDACAEDAELRRRVESVAADAADATLVTAGESAGDRVGRYKLLQLIGEGGCGVVYMAEQEERIRHRLERRTIRLRANAWLKTASSSPRLPRTCRPSPTTSR